MARKPFTEHPMFMTAGRIANAALLRAVEDMRCTDRDLNGFDEHANRVVDELTKLLLKAFDANKAKGSAGGAA